MGSTEAVTEESTPPYSQVEAAKELSSRKSEALSVTLVELLENVVPIPVVCGVIWSPRCNHSSPYVLVPACHYHSSLHSVHTAVNEHAMESGVGVTPDGT